MTEEKYKTWRKTKAGNMVTPLFRAAFVSLLQPKAVGGKNADPNAEKKYGITMIFPKGTDHSALKAAVMEAAKEKWGDKAEAIIRKQEGSDKRIFKDGSDMFEKYAGFEEGVAYLNASNKEKPGLVGTQAATNGDPIGITEENVFYSGCYAIASLRPYCWDNKFGKGVSLSLQNVQMIAEGERLGGGRSKASEDFEAVEDDDMGSTSSSAPAGSDPWA
jgi:hypothetical protein